MADLRARILERVDQLERLAQSASAYGDRWAPDCQDVDGDHIDRVVGDGDEDDPTVIYADGRAINHIATWDPQAVLTLTAGARELVAEHEQAEAFPGEPENRCGTCGYTIGWPCTTIRTVARMLGIDPDA